MQQATRGPLQTFAEDCEGMTTQQAADHLGVSINAIYRFSKVLPGVLSLYAVQKSKRTDETQRMLDEGERLCQQGLSQIEAARELGVDVLVFRKQMHRHKPHLRWVDGRSKRHGGRTLTKVKT